MKLNRIFGLLIFIIVLLNSCLIKKKNYKPLYQKKTFVVFAASGVRLATEEICDLFEKKTGHKVLRNYASSGTLALQILNGAEADIFISANRQWIISLLNAGILAEDAIVDLAANSLAIIAPAGFNHIDIQFTKNFNILTAIPDKIAIGDPAHTPVGEYTMDIFRSLGWHQAVRNKMIKTRDVASVLHIVSLKECDWGVVYLSEAIFSEKVEIIAEIPPGLHSEIVFYIADMKGQTASGHNLLQMFIDKSGKDILRNFGFQV